MYINPPTIRQRTQQYETLKQINAGDLSVEDARQLDEDFLHRGLIRRTDSGQVEVTEKGKQLMFQLKCQVSLNGVALGTETTLDPAVAGWLIGQKFVVEPTKFSPYWAITRRGAAWLETMVQPLAWEGAPMSDPAGSSS